MSRADKITDPALHQSFLERIEVNREIVTAYQQQERNQVSPGDDTPEPGTG
jgi:hypothetical protein